MYSFVCRTVFVHGIVKSRKISFVCRTIFVHGTVKPRKILSYFSYIFNFLFFIGFSFHL